jgi:hypothetical protein
MIDRDVKALLHIVIIGMYREGEVRALRGGVRGGLVAQPHCAGFHDVHHGSPPKAVPFAGIKDGKCLHPSPDDCHVASSHFGLQVRPYGHCEPQSIHGLDRVFRVEPSELGVSAGRGRLDGPEVGQHPGLAPLRRPAAGQVGVLVYEVLLNRSSHIVDDRLR